MNKRMLWSNTCNPYTWPISNKQHYEHRRFDARPLASAVDQFASKEMSSQTKTGIKGGDDSTHPKAKLSIVREICADSKCKNTWLNKIVNLIRSHPNITIRSPAHAATPTRIGKSSKKTMYGKAVRLAVCVCVWWVSEWESKKEVKKERKKERKKVSA